MNNNSAIKLGLEEGLRLGIVSQHTIDNEDKARSIDVSENVTRCAKDKRLSAVGTAFEAFVRKEKLFIYV